jgi:GNAT superfamily N-acetyltransferase
MSNLPRLTARRGHSYRPGPVIGVDFRPAQLGEILALRHEELRPGLPRASAMFDGDDEPTTRHFGAFLAATGENVGCASFVVRPFASGGGHPLDGQAGVQLRGMATRSDLVGRGIGGALLAYAECALEEPGGRPLLWCNARIGAAAFYEKVGWTIVSPQFDIPTVGPHYTMLRR